MKATEEIYSIRFNKAILKDGDIHFSVYTLGVPIFSYNSTTPLVPVDITLNSKTNKITVLFNNREKHIIFYNPDVELFTREKETKKDNGKED
jgi:hypothetical protein